MCGIFAYLNFLTPKKRSEIVDILVQGLQRMEYRGYDSAGIAIDGSNDIETPHSKVALLRKAGKVSVLSDYIKESSDDLDMDMEYNIHCGIAHTRWATHGSPRDVNSHPHRSNDKNEFLVVHNGIITNYREIKEYLEKKGHKFESETDTEVIAKLAQHIHDRYPDFSFRQLVETVIQQLEGAFALAFKSSRFPGQLVASRRGSPLLVGIKSNSRLQTNHFPVSFSKGRRFMSNHATHLRDETSFVETPNNILDLSIAVRSSNGSAKLEVSESTTAVRPFDSADWEVEYFVASDAAAIIEHTKQVLFLEDDDVAFVEDGALTIHRISRHADNGEQKREVQLLEMELQEIMKGSYKTYMQKEIFEQPDSVVNTMRGRLLPSGQVVLGGIKEYLPDIKRCRRLIMVACGTSFHSAIACRQILEELSELPVVVELASDFLDRETPIFRDDVCLFISQSGETADTLMALRYCKPRGALTIGVTNTVGSSICRESHCGIHINAGPEIGVASTKAYTSQILSLLMFALTLSDDRISMGQRRQEIIDALNDLPNLIRNVLDLDQQVHEIAQKIYKEKSLLIMGRGFNFATCLEGALKIKELSYMHCEGIMSGELKHGPLAMVDEFLSICMVICNDHVYKKSLNALQQVVARKGAPIIIADRSVPEDDLAGMKHVLRVPKTVDCVQNILTVIPLQLLSYHIAELNGANVDRPRNLAKSVTVE
uniref:glutamine--fructose-6-phosphate transaminase (isomerizing) n=1 Tax=Caenorhabditis tropicalis TaxID=1561998 RepID=A0A1I7TFB6_9PELO